MAFVVDTSVVLAWFDTNQATAHTRRLHGRATREALHAPALMPLEIVNAVWSLQKRKRASAHQCDRIVSQAARLRVTLHPETDMAVLLGLAREHNLSSYDAAYLALARRLGIPLAAKDGPLLTAARRAGVPLA